MISLSANYLIITIVLITVLYTLYSYYNTTPTTLPIETTPTTLPIETTPPQPIIPVPTETTPQPTTTVPTETIPQPTTPPTVTTPPTETIPQQTTPVPTETPPIVTTPVPQPITPPKEENILVAKNIVIKAEPFGNLNGLDIETGALFSRNDIGNNIFDGILEYNRHPIGWVISLSKTIIFDDSNSDNFIDILTKDYISTEFNTLSNGVWSIGCNFNNLTSNGKVQFVQVYYGDITGGFAINGGVGSNAENKLLHQRTGNLSLFSLSYPELIIRTNGNGKTGLSLYIYCSNSNEPATIIFNMWAIKIA